MGVARFCSGTASSTGGGSDDEGGHAMTGSGVPRTALGGGRWSTAVRSQRARA
jgi:hypothetical protein